MPQLMATSAIETCVMDGARTPPFIDYQTVDPAGHHQSIPLECPSWTAIRPTSEEWGEWEK